MVFNGDADDQDICTLADDIAKTDDTDFPLKMKARLANWCMRDIFKVIMQVYGGWTLNDPNTAGPPEATQNLGIGTRIYAIASAQWIAGVEYSDANGVWTRIHPITLEEIHDRGQAETEFMKTNGNPLYYRPVGNGIKLYPGANFAVALGLKAHISKDITPFTSASTTAEPGFDSLAGHENLALGMAVKYEGINRLDSYQAHFNDWILFLASLRAHYAEKFKREYPTRVRRATGVVDQYV